MGAIKYNTFNMKKMNRIFAFLLGIAVVFAVSCSVSSDEDAFYSSAEYGELSKSYYETSVEPKYKSQSANAEELRKLCLSYAEPSGRKENLISGSLDEFLKNKGMSDSDRLSCLNYLKSSARTIVFIPVQNQEESKTDSQKIIWIYIERTF